MLIIVVVLTGGIAIAGLIAFVILCAGIRREDRTAGLDGPAPGFAAQAARRFTGLRTQPPDDHSRSSCPRRAAAADRARAGR